MRRSTIVAAALLLVVAVVPTSTQSANLDLQAFVGTWKQNTAKTRSSAPSTLTYTFSQEKDGFVSIARAGVQLRDRVRFDGQDYPTPGVPGRTVSWTKISDTVYETTITRNGARVAKGRWILSEGGKRLTQETTPVRVDDKTVTNVTEYVRTSGKGNSLLGEWKPVASLSPEADLFVVTLVEAGALKVLYPRNQGTYTIRPDGQKHAVAGSRAVYDMASSAEPIGPRSFRRTTWRDQKPLFETVMSVSSDGKTLTVTHRTVGSPNEPSLFVYEKQD